MVGAGHDQRKVGSARDVLGWLCHEIKKTASVGEANMMLSQNLTMAKQKFRSTRLGGFSGTKAYILVCRDPEKTP
jgi:hypothetical protein